MYTQCIYIWTRGNHIRSGYPEKSSMKLMNVERAVEGLPPVDPGRTMGTIWHSDSKLDSTNIGGISSVQCSLMVY